MFNRKCKADIRIIYLICQSNTQIKCLLSSIIKVTLTYFKSNIHYRVTLLNAIILFTYHFNIIPNIQYNLKCVLVFKLE